MFYHSKHRASPRHSVRSGLMASCVAVSALGLVMPARAGTVIVNFDPPGSQSTFVGGINDSGAVTGYYSQMVPGVGAQRGFVRAPDGTFQTFSPPGSRATFAESIDTDGAVAGHYTDAETGAERGFVRTVGATPESDTITEFDALVTSRAVSTYAMSIGNGDVAGSFTTDGSRFHGFIRYADGKVTTFDPQGSTSTYAQSIRNGFIAGYYSEGGYDHCFLRVPGGAIIGFNPPGSIDAKCYGIDASGWVAGYFTGTDGGHTIGFVRSPAGAFTMFDGNGEPGDTHAFGINDKKTVAGSWYDPDGMSHGFIRGTAGNMKLFDPAGSTDTTAVGINTKGVVAGYWQDSYGQDHGFLRTPAKTPIHPWVPAPAAPLTRSGPPNGVIMKVDPPLQTARADDGPTTSNRRPVADSVKPWTHITFRAPPLPPNASPTTASRGPMKDPIRPLSHTSGTTSTLPAGVIMKVAPRKPSAADSAGPGDTYRRIVVDPVKPLTHVDFGAPPAASGLTEPSTRYYRIVKDPVRPLPYYDGKSTAPAASTPDRITDPLHRRVAAN